MAGRHETSTQAKTAVLVLLGQRNSIQLHKQLEHPRQSGRDRLPHSRTRPQRPGQFTPDPAAPRGGQLRAGPHRWRRHTRLRVVVSRCRGTPMRRVRPT